MKEGKMIVDLNSNVFEDDEMGNETYKEGTSHNYRSTTESQCTNRKHNRHNQKQIEELEAFFKRCPNPNVKEREALSHELGMEPLQVKYWFQNKRTQMKSQHERQDYLELQVENKKLRADNSMCRETLTSATCSLCGGTTLIPKISCKVSELKAENEKLRQKIDYLLVLIGNSNETPSS